MAKHKVDIDSALSLPCYFPLVSQIRIRTTIDPWRSDNCDQKAVTLLLLSLADTQHFNKNCYRHDPSTSTPKTLVYHSLPVSWKESFLS